MRKMEFIFDGVELGLSENDIDIVLQEWNRKNPGKEMPSKDFADACMEKLYASAVPVKSLRDLQ